MFFNTFSGGKKKKKRVRQERSHKKVNKNGMKLKGKQRVLKGFMKLKGKQMEMNSRNIKNKPVLLWACHTPAAPLPALPHWAPTSSNHSFRSICNCLADL